LLEESIDSLKTDPVIEAMHCKEVLLRMINDVSNALSGEKPKLLIEAADTLRAVIVLLSDYYITAKNIIRENITLKKEKKLISTVAEILVIEIQRRGYSREHIRHCSKMKLASKLLRRQGFDVT